MVIEMNQGGVTQKNVLTMFPPVWGCCQKGFLDAFRFFFKESMMSVFFVFCFFQNTSIIATPLGNTTQCIVIKYTASQVDIRNVH